VKNSKYTNAQRQRPSVWSAQRGTMAQTSEGLGLGLPAGRAGGTAIVTMSHAPKTRCHMEAPYRVICLLCLEL